MGHIDKRYIYLATSGGGGGFEDRSSINNVKISIS